VFEHSDASARKHRLIISVHGSAALRMDHSTQLSRRRRRGTEDSVNCRIRHAADRIMSAIMIMASWDGERTGIIAARSGCHSGPCASGWPGSTPRASTGWVTHPRPRGKRCIAEVQRVASSLTHSQPPRRALSSSPDRCRVPTSGWSGQGSTLGPIVPATRSVLEAATRGVGTARLRGQEGVCTSGVQCLVRAAGVWCRVSLPPWVGLLSRGTCAVGGWCVAPSLTSVLEPFRVLPARRHDER
jgi:hypothetical protein